MMKPDNFAPSDSAAVPASTPAKPGGMRSRIVPTLRRLQPAFIVVLICALFFDAPRSIALRSWFVANVVYALVAITWTMFHWRPLWGTRDVSLRWATGLTLGLTLLVYSTPGGIWASLINTPPQSAGNALDALWFQLAGAVVGFFCLLMATGMAGASVGAFAGRRSDDIRLASHIGVHVCMFTASIVFIFLILPDRFAPTPAVRSGLLFSIPLLTWACWRWNRRQSAYWLRSGRALSAAWKRLLIWRLRRKGRSVVFDARGAALGAVIAGVLLALPAQLIGPVQSQAFTTMRRLGSSVMSSNSPFFTPPSEEQRSRFTNHRRLDMFADRKRIAILHMDEAARYDASRRSEAAIQVDVIVRLENMGVAAIVVPLPYMYNDAYPVWASVSEGAAPNDDDVTRNRADAGLLADVLRRFPNVLLALPSSVSAQRGKDAKVDQLLAASPWHGSMALAWSQMSFLPVIPAAWNAGTTLPPLTALACATLTEPAFFRRQARQKKELPARLRDFPGCAAPQVEPGGVLVDFIGRGAREDFLHTSYAAARANAPIQDLGEDRTPAQWRKTSDVLRGRIVFLESLAHPLIQTPKGAITEAEEQAYAVSTLLAGESFRRVPYWSFALLTLLLACGVGHACARADPLDAVIRGALPLFLTLILSIIALINTYWLDPVVPALAVVMSLAFATQLRFTRERADRQRTSDMFGRFVAPHMVQTWLAQTHEELGLGGKRERLCILFADVRGFTTFAEQHDAGVVIDVINAYMTALTDALHAYNGILDKYTGDGLMAFFQIAPSPSSTASDADTLRLDIAQAVRAALAMRDAAANLSVVRALAGKPTLDLGFALHYGEAVVGLVGNIKQQVNYTALGLAVVVAARLQTIAQGGQVIVSEEVYRETQDRFAFTVGEPVQVKGLTAPVRPYLVVAGKEESAL